MAYSTSKENPICFCLLLSAISHTLYALAPLSTRFKSALPPGFVDHHCHCVGKIEAPVSRNHGDTDSLLLGNRSQNLSRQPTAFRAKDKGIAGSIVDQIVLLSAFGGNRK